MVVGRRMTPAQFRDTLGALGITQARLGRLLGLDKNTANRWATGSTEVPQAVAVLLRLVAAGRLTVDDLDVSRAP